MQQRRPDDGQTRAVEHEMEALAGRDRSQTAPQMLTAPGERRIVGGGEVEVHHPEQGMEESFGLAQREMVEESQGQGGLDGEIRVPALPAPPAAPARYPGSDRFRGQPHRHIAASNKGLIVGRPVRNAIFRLVRGMDLQLHPCSVAPAEGHEKCGPNRPTPAGSSCNNATQRPRVQRVERPTPGNRPENRECHLTSAVSFGPKIFLNRSRWSMAHVLISCRDWVSLSIEPCL